MTAGNDEDGVLAYRPHAPRSMIPLPVAMAGAILLLAVSALALMRLPVSAGGERSALALLLFGLGAMVVLGALAAWVVAEIGLARAAPATTARPAVAMSAFIGSEIVFFAAFFAVYLYYAADPEIAGLSAWPPASARPPAAWGGPLVNTLVLLASGVAVAVSHGALLRGYSRVARLCLAGAIALGITFLALQAREYGLSPLRYEDGIYPSLFYLATGFHGFHVAIGLVMLAVCVARIGSGRLHLQRHFGFEAAVWYWHFVDAVWLVLFAVFYVWVS